MTFLMTTKPVGYIVTVGAFREHPEAQAEYEAICADASAFETYKLAECGSETLTVTDEEPSFGYGENALLAVTDIYCDGNWIDEHAIVAHRPMFMEDIQPCDMDYLYILIQEFEDCDLIEDRLEYAVEDFLDAYPILTKFEAEVLYWMVHNH